MPEFVNLYCHYAGRGLSFFRWYQRRFEFQAARVAVEGRSNVVVLNMHAQLQISLLCAFGDSVPHRLFIWQFFNLFALFKLKQQQNLMKIRFSCIHFPVWPYPPPPPPPQKKREREKKKYFILVNCMGWQVWDRVTKTACWRPDGQRRSLFVERLSHVV